MIPEIEVTPDPDYKWPLKCMGTHLNILANFTITWFSVWPSHLGLQSCTKRILLVLACWGGISDSDRNSQGLQVCNNKLGWDPMHLAALPRNSLRKCKLSSFIYSLIHSFTHFFILSHSFLQQILSEHQLCGRDCARCWRSVWEDTGPVYINDPRWVRGSVL